MWASVLMIAGHPEMGTHTKKIHGHTLSNYFVPPHKTMNALSGVCVFLKPA